MSAAYKFRTSSIVVLPAFPCMKNLFSHLPSDQSQEHFETLLATGATRVERIVSYGQTSPDSGWYEQEENEWVLVLKGYGIIEYDSGEVFRLEAGDHLDIPAHQKHRVIETSSLEATIWLAVFYL